MIDQRPTENKKKQTLAQFNPVLIIILVVLFLVIIAFFLLATGTPLFEQASNDSALKEISRLENSIRVLEEMLREPDTGIPVKLLEKSEGLIIIPDVIKAAFIIGGRHGKGIFIIRQPDRSWSAPCFIDLKGGSAGWQVGVEAVDVILVFRTKRSIENMVRGKFTLGADAGIAVGPQGRQVELSTDAELKAEIYSYSKSRGLYAGVSFQGASLTVDRKANENFYGKKGVTAADILKGKFNVSRISAVEKLWMTIGRFSEPAK